MKLHGDTNRIKMKAEETTYGPSLDALHLVALPSDLKQH